jgi:hypothetical protein
MGEGVIQYLEEAWQDVKEVKSKKLNLKRRIPTQERASTSEEDVDSLSLYNVAREVANGKVCEGIY